jgi:hypothetical protein
MLLWAWTTLSPSILHFIINFGDPDTALRCIVTIIIVYTLAGWICIDGVEVEGALLCNSCG